MRTTKEVLKNLNCFCWQSAYEIMISIEAYNDAVIDTSVKIILRGMFDQGLIERKKIYRYDATHRSNRHIYLYRLPPSDHPVDCAVKRIPKSHQRLIRIAEQSHNSQNSQQQIKHRTHFVPPVAGQSRSSFAYSKHC